MSKKQTAAQLKKEETKAKARLAELVPVTGDGTLDGLVHDLVSQQASAVNNSGVQGQIDWLVENYGTVEALRMIEEVIK